MRIVLASTALSKGGVWRHIEGLASALAQREHDVVIGLPQEAAQLREAARASGLRSAPWERTLLWREAVWHGHLHDTFDPRFLAAAAVRHVLGPTILTEHAPRTNASDEGLLPGPRRIGAWQAKTAFKRTQFAFVDAVIAVSEGSAAFLSERYRLPPTRATVVHNGLTSDVRPSSHRSSACEGTITVLCVGSLIVEKGQHLLISAAARAHQPWRVLFVGTGPSEERLRRQAADLEGRVRFAGWRDDIHRLIAEADVVCVPSLWESFGYVALEAMIAGRPVVAFPVDGLRDLVVNDTTGVLVPPADVTALARALDRLAGDPGLRSILGRAAKARAEQRFTLELMVARTLEVYRRVTKPDTPR